MLVVPVMTMVLVVQMWTVAVVGMPAVVAVVAVVTVVAVVPVVAVVAVMDVPQVGHPGHRLSMCIGHVGLDVIELVCPVYLAICIDLPNLYLAQQAALWL